MTAIALIVVVFALFCCGLALWVILGDRPERPDTLAGMTPDALELVKRANRR